MILSSQRLCFSTYLNAICYNEYIRVQDIAEQKQIGTIHMSHFRLISYLELHDPALVRNNIMCDGIDLSPISAATHHHPIRRAAETLY